LAELVEARQLPFDRLREHDGLGGATGSGDDAVEAGANS